MKLPKFLKKRRNLWIIGGVIVLIAFIYFVAGRKNNAAGIQTGKVIKQHLQETVLATGQVVSGTDLDLSFQGTGVIRKILVHEGDKVSEGQLLAYVDQGSAAASLTSAQGTLAQAEANYEKLLAGATAQNIQTSKDAVHIAQQDLANEYSGAINTLQSAHASIYNAYNAVLSIQNSYFSTSDQQGLEVSDARSDISTNMQSLKTALDTAGTNPAPATIDAIIPEALLALNKAYNDVGIVRAACDQGIYYTKVTSADKASLDTQKTTLNTSISEVTSLQHSLASLQIALQKAQDQLNLTTAPPTQADIDYAKAQILAAQGQVNAAEASLSNLTIHAPASGTITEIDKKQGELANSLAQVMVLQDVGDLHTEADVSEANIASLQVGQPVSYTFDALGPDQQFQGNVLTINLSSTVVSGVVDYKVKGSLGKISGIKPGMTVNMTILVAQKDNALAVPATAVVNKSDGQYVKVIDDLKHKTYHEVKVHTGLQADGGLMEIVSGLQEGQEIVTYMK